MPEGVLTEAWQETELGQLGSFSRGRGGTRADEDPNGLPCIRYGDVYTHHDCIVRSFASSISPSSASSYTPLQPGDVVFAGSGETFEDIGKAVAYCHDNPAYAGADTIIFRPGPRLLPQFAGYALNSDYANAHKSRMGQGSSVIHIGAEHLSRIGFRLPPVEQQKRVAEILSTVDEAIEQTEALVAKTQQIKAGLMHDLFTRGVTADGQLRPPREEAPQLYKESPLGCIPQEWRVESLGSLGSFMNGLNKPKDQFGFGLKFVNISNVYPEHLEIDSLGLMNATAAEYGRYGLRAGDILIDRSSVKLEGVGYPTVFPDSAESVVFCGFIIRFRVTDSRLFPTFAVQAMRSPAFRRLVFQIATVSANVNVNQQALKRLPMLLPSTDEQLLIKKLSDVSYQALQKEFETVCKLKDLRKGLMKDLLTGRVSVVAEAPAKLAEVSANV